jgi:hypothetical protein
VKVVARDLPEDFFFFLVTSIQAHKHKLVVAQPFDCLSVPDTMSGRIHCLEMPSLRNTDPYVDEMQHCLREILY